MSLRIYTTRIAAERMARSPSPAILIIIVRLEFIALSTTLLSAVCSSFCMSSSNCPVRHASKMLTLCSSLFRPAILSFCLPDSLCCFCCISARALATESAMSTLWFTVSAVALFCTLVIPTVSVCCRRKASPSLLKNPFFVFTISYTVSRWSCCSAVRG